MVFKFKEIKTNFFSFKSSLGSIWIRVSQNIGPWIRIKFIWYLIWKSCHSSTSSVTFVPIFCKVLLVLKSCEEVQNDKSLIYLVIFINIYIVVLLSPQWFPIKKILLIVYTSTCNCLKNNKYIVILNSYVYWFVSGLCVRYLFCAANFIMKIIVGSW